jgi:DNA-directed RNA polymerase subunit M/transcription elongation factor TFIIS
MPISCECPECGKRLKAADSAAGKKAKCPDCGAAIPIPAPKVKKKSADDEEFDLQNMNVEEGVEGPIEEDQKPCPMCGEFIKAAAVKCRHCGEDIASPRAKKKGKRSRSGGGMPATVIVAIAVEILFILLNLAGVIVQLIQMNICGAAGSGIRLAIEITILAGFFKRKSWTRTAALVLSGVGIVFMFICGGVLLFAGQNPQIMAQIGEDFKWILGIILGVQVVLYITQITALVSGSAQEYLDQ